MDCSKFVFGNAISRKAYNKAIKAKAKFVKKFGDDTDTVYHIASKEAPVIGKALGVRNIVISPKSACRFDATPKFNKAK